MNRFLALAGLTGFLLLAQAQASEWSETVSPPEGENSSDYLLGSGDLIELKVFGVPQLDLTTRISESGTVDLPLLGTVKVSDLSTRQLKNELERQLEDGGFLIDPQVTVLIREYLSQQVKVLGMVKKPGQYQITHPTRLLDILAMAGGIVEERSAGKVVIQSVEKRSSLDGTPPLKIRTIDLAGLLEHGESSLNVPIRSGDVVNIPERPETVYYVVGDVNRPGSFELPRSGRLYASQALAIAGGPMRTAKPGKSRIYRFNVDGTRKQITLDFKRILEGKKPDAPLHPDDVLYVPGSAAKSIGYALMGIVPRTLSEIIANSIVR